MGVRNFFVNLQVDGRGNVKAGPRAADGGFKLELTQRDRGAIVPALTVEGRVQGKMLVTLVLDGDGNELHRVETPRGEK